MTKKIGIIGAGISGLLACKYALEKRFEPVVFEAGSEAGGVWTKTVATTKLQTPKSVYQFTDFPWPSSVSEDFPTSKKVFDYIKAYADHFDLIRHIKFHSKVVSIDYQETQGEGVWNIEVEDPTTLTIQIYQVDFVMLCVGRFSGVPNIPEFAPNQGPEAFEGEVIHSIDYSAMDDEKAADYVKGKKVTVVGFQKSALDITQECATVNGVENPVTVIIRKPHWNVSDYLPWGVPLAFLYLNRLSELTVYKPGEGLILSLLATMLSPLRWAVSKFVESDIKRKHHLKKYGVVPDHSFLQDIHSCLVSTVPKGFYNNVEKGSIMLKRSQNFSFCKEGVLVDGEDRLVKSDLVILATGFKGVVKLKGIFSSPTYQEYIAGTSDRIIPLYRQCIHPRIPRLAVIGFSESLSNLYTSEIQCRWFLELIDGTFKLPSIQEMDKDISRWDEFHKMYSKQYYRRSCFGALHIWYNDQLCKDMGWNPKRKKGFLAELIAPYGPQDYAKK
ncbi:putative flavin-containing monooxygenase 1 [Drosera capensis]